MLPYRNSYRGYTELNPAKKPLKDRRNSQADGKQERVPDIDELFDAAIRHRFGVLISCAVKP